MSFKSSAVFALVAGCMTILACSNTPVYEGRDASEWMNLLGSDSSSERAEAAYVLSGRLQTEASIPLLVMLLADSIEIVRDEAVSGLISIGRTSAARADAVRNSLRLAVRSQSADTRVLAVNIIGGLGEAGEPTLSVLSELLSDRAAQVRAAAASALRNASQRADNQRLDLLILLAGEDSSEIVRAAAAETLGTVHGADVSVGAALRRALRDRSPLVREHAAFAIANAENAGHDVVGPLTEALGDPSPEVRSAAAQSLTNLGRRAIWAKPALQRALTDSVPFVRARVSQALATIRGP